MTVNHIRMVAATASSRLCLGPSLKVRLLGGSPGLITQIQHGKDLTASFCPVSGRHLNLIMTNIGQFELRQARTIQEIRSVVVTVALGDALVPYLIVGKEAMESALFSEY